MEISVAVDGKTFLPFEPIYSTMTVTNTDKVARLAPRLPRGVHPAYMDVLLASSAGDTYQAGNIALVPHSFNPAYGRVTAPGERLTCRFDVADWTGVRNGYAWSCLPPGTYRVLSSWRRGLFSAAIRLGAGTAVSESFVVRTPEGDTASAAQLYGERLFYEWGARLPDAEDRSRRLAYELLDRYPRIGPYVVPTLSWLALRKFADWFHARTSDSRPALAESSAAAYRSVVEEYPDSPTAVFMLSRSDILDSLSGAGAHHTYLIGLSERLPGTAVGREAARLLSDVVPSPR